MNYPQKLDLSVIFQKSVKFRSKIVLISKNNDFYRLKSKG